jgi:hypothetical protein
MNPELELTWEQTQRLVNTLIFNQTSKYLSDVEIKVLQGAWAGESYDNIAKQLVLSVSYINKDVGYRLWQKLSSALGEDVTKKNFRQALLRKQQQQTALVTDSATLITPVTTTLEFSEGSSVTLGSPFYVERPPIEADCYREIVKSGALIRIRAPQRMGKTSLLNRILAHAAQQGDRTVRINLRNAEKTVFTHLDKFLRWLCANVSRDLHLESRLNDYWDEEIGSKVSCTGYFQSYLLAQLDTNLVLGLDEIDTVFNYPDIAEDFLALLREWHEEAMIQPDWQRLRLVISHSTEVYLSLNIHRSPFNVGLPVRLPPFNLAQVEALAQLHELSWTATATQQLTAMVGGHPYLIRLALYHLARQATTLAQLLQDAPTHAGIYGDHLRCCLGHLNQQPELVAALKQVVTAPDSVQLDSVPVYQLDSMGLVHLRGNQISPSCELYRQYFSANLV